MPDDIDESRVYVCLDCLNQQESFLKPCENCGSRKLEHVDFKKQQYGENWREVMRARIERSHTGDRGMLPFE